VSHALQDFGLMLYLSIPAFLTPMFSCGLRVLGSRAVFGFNGSR
jgi:hypothetical protein